jgi:rod shape determining protein RodA
MSAVTSHRREDASQRGWQYRLHLDAPLLLALIGVSGLGLMVLYSAGGEDADLLGRQLIRLAIAFATMFAVAQVSPRLLMRITPWVFAAGILLLLAVLMGGEASGGAQRWLNLYVVRSPSSRTSAPPC